MPDANSHIRTILIDVIPPELDEDSSSRRLHELELLTQTYGGIVVVSLYQKRAAPHYRTFIGPGKLDEVIEIAKETGAKLLVVNNILKPKQMFEIEQRIRKHGLRVWDRMDLILNIFAKHAKTSVAKLQIRLAAIRHMGPRIFGMGSELMRQAGGVGGRAGKGESNTEIMKRHLAGQERQIKKELERLDRARSGHRDRRTRIGFKTVSLVGYTNAGKSSLLRALTKKDAYVADELFATLDTKLGKLWLPNANASVLLSDTIGFIQDLPPDLIKAFRSTLDEVLDADLLLHVIDISDPYYEDKIIEVEDVLESIGVGEKPKLYVFNKLDQAKRLPIRSIKKRYSEYHPVFASAHSGEGLDRLRDTIEAAMFPSIPRP